MSSRFFFVVAFCLIANLSGAQVYFGVTGDFGNNVTISPQPSGHILTSPGAPSFSVMLLQQKQMHNNWHLRFGLAAGILGYIIKTKDGVDTVSTTSGPTSYTNDWNYFMPYASAHLDLGKSVLIGNRKITFFLGAGGTVYANTASSTGGYVVISQGKSADLYYYYMESKEKNFKGFVETSIQTNIKRWAIVGLRYQHHFNPALTGTYQFYNMNNPPSGTLSLTQRTISILFLVRIGGWRSRE